MSERVLTIEDYNFINLVVGKYIEWFRSIFYCNVFGSMCEELSKKRELSFNIITDYFMYGNLEESIRTYLIHPLTGRFLINPLEYTQNWPFVKPWQELVTLLDDLINSHFLKREE